VNNRRMPFDRLADLRKRNVDQHPRCEEQPLQPELAALLVHYLADILLTR
jgi:hypothetical protein